MEAVHTHSEKLAKATEKSEVSALDALVHFDEEELEFNRYGIISVGFLLIGTIGGLTVGLSAFHHLWQIALIAVFTMIPFSLMLAVAPMKWVVRTTAFALALDLAIVALNFLL